MAKIASLFVTLLGVLLVLGLLGIGFDWTTRWVQWVIAILVFAAGLTKLIKNYSSKKSK
jgi:ABC-type phosphate transport system auxiliary subunit